MMAQDSANHPTASSHIPTCRTVLTSVLGEVESRATKATEDSNPYERLTSGLKVFLARLEVNSLVVPGANEYLDYLKNLNVDELRTLLTNYLESIENPLKNSYFFEKELAVDVILRQLGEIKKLIGTVRIGRNCELTPQLAQGYKKFQLSSLPKTNLLESIFYCINLKYYSNKFVDVMQSLSTAKKMFEARRAVISNWMNPFIVEKITSDQPSFVNVELPVNAMKVAIEMAENYQKLHNESYIKCINHIISSQSP